MGQSILLFLLLIIISSPCFAEPTKTVFNPFTGKQDYITRIDSNTVVAGTNVSVLSNSNGTVTISSSGSGGGTTCGSNPIGVQFTDASSCTWCETVAITGNLITTLISCPVVVASRRCTIGMPRGLLLSLTCGPND